MTKRQPSEHARAAKMIRAELKRHGIPAKVRARTASMMTAVDVDVTDVSPATRREIERFVGQFQYGSFDGMRDSYEHTNQRDDIPQVKWASVHVRHSDEMRAEAEAFCAGYWADWDSMSEMDRSDRIYRTLRNDQQGTEGYRFWQARKPRVRVA